MTINQVVLFNIKRLFCLLVIATCAHMANGQAYFLNGDALYMGNDCYRLTTTQGNQNGTVWYADQININEPFDLLFEMFFGNLDANGADGIVFILQTDGTGAIGNTGEGMGYSGFSPSLGVEFDTWQNGNLFDPTFDHIAIQRNGNVNHNSPQQIAGPVQASTESVNIEDAQYHPVRIVWDPETQIMDVYFDCELRISSEVPMNGIFGQQEDVWWGFSGATGGAWNNQIVCLSENILDLAPDVSMCSGSSVELFIGGDPDGTFEWSPAEFLDNPNSQSPTATPLETTTFYVEYTDLCGETSSDSLTVWVQDLEVSIPQTVDISCLNPEVEILAESNFPSELDYVWTTDDGLIIEGDSTETLTIGGPGTYYVTGSFNADCLDSTEVVVDANYDDFDASISSPGDITCLEDNTSINVDPVISNGVTFDWTTLNGNITGGLGTSTIDVDQAGTYTVDVYLNKNCNTTVEWEVLEDFEPYSIDINSSGNIDCITATVDIQAVINGTGPDFEWETDGNIIAGLGSNSIEVDAAGTYTIIVVNPNNGCESSAEIEVTEDTEVPDVSIALPDTLTCRTPDMHLNGSAPGPVGFDYDWTTDGNIVEGENSLNPLVDAPGTYTLTVLNLDNNCEASATVEVLVNEDFFIDVSTLTMPNVFTPNQDAHNEVFKPYLASDPEYDVENIMQDYQLQIFNRWGNLIFESTGTDRSWDGTVNGETLAAGSYYYTLNYSISCSVNEDGNLDGQVQLIISQ